jgi:ABC-type dipeptide/oligopeptide/nickel transport system permease component
MGRHAARRLLVIAASFLGITIATFALLAAAPQLTSETIVGEFANEPRRAEQIARLRERYALDRPAFLNFAVHPGRALPDGVPPEAREPGHLRALVDRWLAAARREASGRTPDTTSAERAAVEVELARSRAWVVPVMVPALLDEDAPVRDAGFGFLGKLAPIPHPGSATPTSPAWDEATRRRARLWWRRHAIEYEQHSAFWSATVGLVTQSRYAAWLGDLLRLDLGDSISIEAGTRVASLIGARLPVTMLVMGGAILLLFGIGVPIGIASAARRGSVFDRASQGLLFFFHAVPEFWIATLALVYLCSAAHWKLFPVGGLHAPEIDAALRSGTLSWSSPAVWRDTAHHLVLPVASIVIGSLAIVSRHVRAASIEVLGARFVTAARARGIPESRIRRVHVPRNIAAPVVALVASALPALVTGSLLVEVIFSLNGMGRLAYLAAIQRDVPVCMGILTLVAAVTLVSYALGDLAQAWLDPRVRLR